jgi:hypothetical protein
MPGIIPDGGEDRAVSARPPACEHARRLETRRHPGLERRSMARDSDVPVDLFIAAYDDAEKIDKEKIDEESVEKAKEAASAAS